MNHFWQKIQKLAVFLGDICLLYLSLWLTLLIRYRQTFTATIWEQHWPIFSGLFLLWLIIFYAFNLYDIQRGKSNLEFFNNFLNSIVINIALGVLYFYLLAGRIAIRPKTIFVILVIIHFLLFLLWRRLVSKIFSSKKLYTNLLFVGQAPLIKELLPRSGSFERFGYLYKGIITLEPLNEPVINLPQYSFEQLMEIIKREKINLLVINQPENERITNLLFQALPLRINFISLTNFYEQNTQRIPLKNINHGWFLDNFSEGNKAIFETTKRILDLLLAFISSLVSLPLVPLIALTIAVDSRGNVFFRQPRVGKDGKIFTALKFRTMYLSAEKAGPMWAQENDPRVTKIGRWLRKVRLDEIPQLWNILKGDMSFVGPRPERPEFIDDLTEKIPFYKERLLVKPGLTGWAQINFPYASSAEDSLKKLQYDLYYIKHRSLFLDLSIILKTINTIIKGGGR